MYVIAPHPWAGHSLSPATSIVTQMIMTGLGKLCAEHTALGIMAQHAGKLSGKECKRLVHKCIADVQNILCDSGQLLSHTDTR